MNIRFNYFNNLNNTQINQDHNVSSNQLYFLKKFIINKPFKIIQCDKNIGTAIVSHELHNQLCINHLNDTKIYQQLDYNPLNETIDKIEQKLKHLSLNKDLNISLNLLMTKNSKIGKFRILCKLHKTSFGIRPIINNCLHPTSQLCKFIDLLLKPILSETSSYLKDSQHLLQKCNKIIFNNDKVFLYSMDFESLYTNIDKLDACNLITEFISGYLDYNYIQPSAFREILLIIFENNVFTYGTKYFKQNNGLAMGCICGPTVASLFVYILEKHWLNINFPLFYGRFIDDICLITNEKLKESDFKRIFRNLNLNIMNGKEINFLDLKISFDRNIRKLNFSLYVKPTNTFTYLKINSNHPSFIFNNIPKSLFIRIKRICSNHVDYLFFTRKLIFQLLSRGYDYNKLLSLQSSIGNINRMDLLEYKNKSIVKSTKNMFFAGNEYNKFIRNKSSLFDVSFSQIKTNFTWLDSYKLKFYFLISANIFSLLIHNRHLNNKIYFTRKCLSDNCKFCDYVNPNSYILLKNGFVIPIKDSCNCQSSNVIYIIRCILCNVFYVGQTKRRVVERLNEHFEDIKNFIPFIKCTSEVGMHFNLRRHNYRKHFSFYLFKKDIEDLKHRLSIETDLIHIIKEYNPPIVNLKIPSKSKIIFFSFK
jgi:hypothetical protein